MPDDGLVAVHVGEFQASCHTENPTEGLKGQPVWSEIRDEYGVYKDTSWSSYYIDTLYTELKQAMVLTGCPAATFADRTLLC